MKDMQVREYLERPIENLIYLGVSKATIYAIVGSILENDDIITMYEEGKDCRLLWTMQDNLPAKQGFWEIR